MPAVIDVVVRNATSGEREAAIQLTVDAYRQYEASFGSPFWEHYISNIRLQWTEKEDTQRIVAIHNGNLVGAVLWYPPQERLYERLTELIPYPEVRLLGVNPEFRGQGIATALIRECARRSTESGFPYLGLHTSNRMPDAVRLYHKLGFEREPRFDFYGGDSNTLVEAYRLPLGATLSF